MLAEGGVGCSYPRLCMGENNGLIRCMDATFPMVDPPDSDSLPTLRSSELLYLENVLWNHG